LFSTQDAGAMAGAKDPLPSNLQRQQRDAAIALYLAKTAGGACVSFSFLAVRGFSSSSPCRAASFAALALADHRVVLFARLAWRAAC
jgi:hypothetical protein